MTVYISGPITGIPEQNRPAFDMVAAGLEAIGHEPIIPHTLTAPGDPWADCMKACIRAMMDADSVVMIRGWESSRRAKIEKWLAEALGIPVTRHYLDLKAR